MSVWVCPRQPQQIVPFFLIFSPSLSWLLPALLPSPLLTLPFQMSASQRDISHCVVCVCICVSAQGREKETKEDHIKDFSCLLRSNVLPLSVSFSPLMWPVLISSADIAAVPSPLVEKDSFPTVKDALERSGTHNTETQIHTLSSTFEQWEEAEANRKWLLLRRGMKRSGCSEEHKAKGNFESGEVPAITFLPFYVLHKHTCTNATQ